MNKQTNAAPADQPAGLATDSQPRPATVPAGVGATGPIAAAVKLANEAMLYAERLGVEFRTLSVGDLWSSGRDARLLFHFNHCEARRVDERVKRGQA